MRLSRFTKNSGIVDRKRLSNQMERFGVVRDDPVRKVHYVNIKETKIEIEKYNI